MGLLIKEVAQTEEEYIQFELQSETKHEYIDGRLIKMPGESLINNKLLNLYLVFLKGI